MLHVGLVWQKMFLELLLVFTWILWSTGLPARHWRDLEPGRGSPPQEKGPLTIHRCLRQKPRGPEE